MRKHNCDSVTNDNGTPTTKLGNRHNEIMNAIDELENCADDVDRLLYRISGEDSPPCASDNPDIVSLSEVLVRAPDLIRQRILSINTSLNKISDLLF